MQDEMQKPRGALPPNAMLELIEPTHQRLYWPMGEQLLFQTNEPALLNAADEAFGCFSAPSTTENPQSPLVFRLFAHNVVDASNVEHSRPVYRTQGHLYYISAGAGSTVVADLLRGYAFGFVTPEVAHDRAFVRYVFLEGIVLSMLSTTRRFIALHAACVVKNGSGIVLHGKSGTGKSTLAFACARRGYQVLAEDGMLVKVLPGAMRLWGAPWRLHLLPDSQRFFPEIADERPKLQLNGEWKLELDMEMLFPGSTTTDAAPGLVLFLEQGASPGAARIVRVPFAEALRSFEVVWPWWVGWTEEMEHQLSRLLELGTYRMRVAGTPDETVDALDGLLAQAEMERVA